MPTSFLYALFAITWVMVSAFVLVTSNELPPEMASKFDMYGIASTVMTTRDNYRFTYLLTLFMTSGTIVLAFAGVSIASTESINLPHKDYWLAPKRKHATMSYILSWGAIIGIATLLLLGAVHFAVVLAHRNTPPAMPVAALWAPIALYSLVVSWMVFQLWRRFRLPQVPA